MSKLSWTARLALLVVAGAVFGGVVVIASPPGPIDGRNIPSNFGPSKLLATQTNKTGFGNQVVTTGALTGGSELDELYVSKTATELKLAISGNVREPNHVLIFIGGTPVAGLGQTELRAQGVDGPPFTVQNVSQFFTLNTNGTADPGDDTCDLDTNGTILPCEADYAIGIDTFGGNVSVSEYTLSSSAVGSYTCGGTATSPTYASRVFATQTTLDTAPPATNDQGLGYAQIAFRNGNTAGVTSTDCTAAATATTGLEMTIPFSRLGLTGTETITLYVALASDDGFFSNQAFAAQVGSCGTACVSGGFRPDLSTLSTCLTVDLTTLATFGSGDNLSDGTINPADYTPAARRTQTCATDFGDQQLDPNGINLTGGSELNQMYVANDSTHLYMGLSGNLEANGNRVILFIESGQSGGQGGTSTMAFTGGGPLNGMTGNLLPLDQDDAPVDFDYAVEINSSRPSGQPASAITTFVDYSNLLTNARAYYGSNNVNSNGAQFTPTGANANGLTLAYNFLNNTGVQGCGPGSGCDFATNAQVATDAATSTFGFELAIPFADLGIPGGVSGGETFELWAFVTNNNGGFAANQSLPSLRDPAGLVPPDSVENAGGSPTAPANIDYSNDGGVGTCNFGSPSPSAPHCQYAFFARSARYVATGVPAATVTSAVSRRTNPHASGPCDTNLLPPRKSEPHSGGIQEVRIGFDVAPGSGSGASLFEATCPTGTFAASGQQASMSGTVVGSELVLSFSPALTNARTYRIDLGGSITTIAGQSVFVRGLIGDVNSDGAVNATDRSVVVGAWTGPGGWSCPTDVNNSGATNATDRSVVVGAWTGGTATNCAP